MAKETPKKKINTVEMGGSGTTIYGGVVSDVEYNSELNTEYGGGGLNVFNRMRKSDPVVKASLNIIKLGILQAEWYVEPASDDAQDVEIAEFIEEALMQRLDKSWEESLKDILTYLDFGFSVVEKVFKVEDDAKGQPKIYWKKLAYRDQKSIDKFETKDKKEGITQILQGDKVGEKLEDRNPSIPMEKLVVFTNDKEGDNWRGVSILRSAYKPWFFKENFEKIDAIGFEREAVGLPVFTMPQNPDAKDVEKAEEMGKNIRVNEKAHLVLPFGWEFAVMYPSGGNRRNADEAIRRFNRDIYANVLAMFLDLGSGSTGSRALSVDQSRAFYRSLQAIADYLASRLNQEAIKQLVDLNYNEVKQYPKLKATGIEEVDYNVVASALQSLVLAGLLTVDDELEDFVRNQFRLPDRSDEAKRTLVDGSDKPVEGDDTTKLDANGKPIVDNKDTKNKDNKNSKKTDKSALESQKIDEDKKKKEKQSKIEAKEKLKGRKYSEFKLWRPTTFAEDKVNFYSINRQMDLFENEMMRELPKILAPEINNLVNDARLALQMQDAKRVEDMSIKFKEEARNYIIDRLTRAFDAGKLSASNELDIPAVKTNDTMVKMITTQASVMADKLTVDLLNQAKLTTLGQIQQNTPIDDAISNMESLLTSQLVKGASLLASAATVGGINMGRDSVFGENGEKIYAMQRSELLDNRVCNYCLSVDGRTVVANDPMTKHGQFHFKCRGIWASIGKDESEKPEISGIPEQLRERVGTLNEFQQLDRPLPLKGSLAEEFATENENNN